MRFSCQLILLLIGVLFSLSPLVTAQDFWRVIPVETPLDHHALPFMRAIGIPAAATYKGQKRKAIVIISGRTKATGGPGQPVIEVHIDGIQNLISEKDLELFEGPDVSDAQSGIRAFSISVTRGKLVYEAAGSVDLYMGDYPESIVGEDGNNVLGTGVFPKGPRRAAWRQLFHQMSSGFEKGQISIGGKELSPNLEIDFSGNGIEPLLQELIRVVGL